MGDRYSAKNKKLVEISKLTSTDNNFIVGNGTKWVAENGDTVRTSLGLGTANSPTFAGLTLSGLTASKIVETNGDKKLTSASAAVSDLVPYTGADSTLALGEQEITQLLLGDELVENGTFDDDVDDWTLGTGWTYDPGTPYAIFTGQAEGAITQNLGVSGGERYRVVYTITVNGSGLTLVTTLGGATLTARTTSGTYTEDIVTTEAGFLSFSAVFDNEFTALFLDNVSVKRVYTTLISPSSTNVISKDLDIYGDLAVKEEISSVSGGDLLMYAGSETHMGNIAFRGFLISTGHASINFTGANQTNTTDARDILTLTGGNGGNHSGGGNTAGTGSDAVITLGGGGIGSGGANGGDGGAFTLTTGDGGAGATAGTSGTISLLTANSTGNSGDISLTTGTATNLYESGKISLTTGTGGATKSSGDIEIETGQGGPTANSGDIKLIVGAAGATGGSQGNIILGGSTNYTQVSAAGDVSFAGSAGFYPRFLTQSAEPAAGTGATQCDTSEMVVWKDSDDSKVYICFNDGGTVKTVELA